MVMEGVSDKEEGRSIMEEMASALPAHLVGQVQVQTPGGTPIGDIVLDRRKSIQELKELTENMEKELLEMDKTGGRRNIPDRGAKKKRQTQTDKKRRREEDFDEEITDEDDEPNINDGEKIFMRSRTGKAHYLEVKKDMEYLKGMSVQMLVPCMIDWVLACEIKRAKSRNINGTITRQMRANLIRIYCAIGEIQQQKDNMETEMLRTQLKDIEENIRSIKEENANLRKELEDIKRQMISNKNVEGYRSTPCDTNKGKRKNSKDINSAEKTTGKKKRNSHPAVIPLERRDIEQRLRRELSFPRESPRRNPKQTEE